MDLIKDDELKKKTIYFMISVNPNIFKWIFYISIIFIFSIIMCIFLPMDETVKVSILLRSNENSMSVDTCYTGEILTVNYYNGLLVHKGELLIRFKTEKIEEEIQRKNEEKMEIEKYLFLYRALINRTLEYEKIENIDVENITLNDISNEGVNQNIFSTFLANDKIIEILLQIRKIDDEIDTLEKELENAKIFAPSTGFVKDMNNYKKGDVLNAGDNILYIISPESSTIKAELIFNPISIAKVSIGDEVQVIFNDLPPARYGKMKLKIGSIVRDTKTLENGNIVYIAEVSIENPYLISGTNQKTLLVPGMSAMGIIKTGRTTVLFEILKKLNII